MKYVHIKSIQANGYAVCGKFIEENSQVFDRDTAAQMVIKDGATLCPKCAKAKQKKQLGLFP